MKKYWKIQYEYDYPTRWKLIHQGSTRVYNYFNNKKDALAEGKRLAKRDKSFLLVFDKNGKEELWSCSTGKFRHVEI